MTNTEALILAVLLGVGLFLVERALLFAWGCYAKSEPDATADAGNEQRLVVVGVANQTDSDK